MKTSHVLIAAAAVVAVYVLGGRWRVNLQPIGGPTPPPPPPAGPVSPWAYWFGNASNQGGNAGNTPYAQNSPGQLAAGIGVAAGGFASLWNAFKGSSDAPPKDPVWDPSTLPAAGGSSGSSWLVFAGDPTGGSSYT